jgi:hypothetical protein
MLNNKRDIGKTQSDLIADYLGLSAPITTRTKRDAKIILGVFDLETLSPMFEPRYKKNNKGQQL